MRDSNIDGVKWVAAIGRDVMRDADDLHTAALTYKNPRFAVIRRSLGGRRTVAAITDDVDSALDYVENGQVARSAVEIEIREAYAGGEGE